MVGFVSDNVSGVHPQIFKALETANIGYAMPYGNDIWSQKLTQAFCRLFEQQVWVLPCATGTAANSLALSLIAGPINSVCAQRESHLIVDECNAPEMFTGGAKLIPLVGENNKCLPAELKQVTKSIGEVHSPQPSAISITQTTEIGGVYQIAELKALADVAHTNNMYVHMDGARFANAVASLGCTAAQLSTQVGVDLLSFGATKNGCLAAEALVIFNEKLLTEASFRHKRGAQLQSKQRYLAAQLEAYLHKNLWLKNAKHANDMTLLLAKKLLKIDGVSFPHPIESNLMFVKFERQQIKKLQNSGLAGYVYESGLMRLCCSWATQEHEVDDFVSLLESA